MQTVRSWSDLEKFGIVFLTGESCSLMYRILFDLTANGKAIVERCLSVAITSEPWNSGSASDPHVASIMLPREMFTPLAVFALLESGCREVLLCDRAVIGIEASDSEHEAALIRQSHNASRSFAYHGAFKDRNQHQMSGRVK